MDKILETLKSIFRGENIVNKHLQYALLFILPSIGAAAVQYIDKTTPKSIIVAISIFAGIMFILSIVPLLLMTGVYLTFIKDRLSGVCEGIPEITKGQIMKALKTIPLYFVWGIYTILYLTVLFGISSVPIFLLKSAGSLAAILGFMVSIVLYILSVIIVILTTPFVSYIYIKYVNNNFQYSGLLFNPLILVDFIKKSFKPTIVVTLKYILAGIILSAASFIIMIIPILAIVILTVIFAMIYPESVNIDNHWLFIILTVLISSVPVLIQAYLNSILGLSCASELVEVYQIEKL